MSFSDPFTSSDVGPLLTSAMLAALVLATAGGCVIALRLRRLAARKGHLARAAREVREVRRRLAEIKCELAALHGSIAEDSRRGPEEAPRTFSTAASRAVGE